MNIFSFGLAARKIPVILQTEATECGLACIAMIAHFFGNKVSLRELRIRFSVSLKGASLGSLIRVCKHAGLATRPVKVDLAGLHQIRLPCILHWNFNHFVVLQKITKKGAHVIDPALGERVLPISKVSSSFTGVALEIWPGADFTPKKAAKKISLAQLVGNAHGLGKTIASILFLGILLEFVTILAPYFIQLVIDKAVISSDNQVLAILAAGFGVVYLVKNLIASVRAWFLMYIGTSLNMQWKDNVLGHLLSLPLEFFEKRHIGDVTSRFSSIDFIQRMLTTSFIESVLDGLMSIVVLIVLFFYSPMLGLTVLLSCVLYAGVRIAANHTLWNATREEIIYGARQQSHLLETIRGMKPIKLFSKQNERRLVWLSLFADQTNAKLGMQKIEIVLKSTRTLIFDMQNILVIWLGANLVIAGEYTVGALVAFLGYKLIFESRIVALIDSIFTIKNIGLQVDRLSDIVVSKSEEEKSALPVDVQEIRAELEFKNVSFQYSLYEKKVMSGMNFLVQEGESVAIAGPSGCGKSTIFNVILGIYQGAKGQILIGGRDVNSIGAEGVRAIIGTVLQDDMLFSGSIAENISCFDNEARQDWIAECARSANVHNEIDAMPMKYHTLVGDMGTVLSGGQKQRVLLARALYKRPKILLLDEATSHLDIENERIVSAAIKSLNITRIIIAHRPETVLSADRVMLMEGGAIKSSLDPIEAKKILEAMNF
ncbi:peptidase domain-containing ABC transporter [Variovorax sp. ZS18.2.2]|uniref:peptidase domain-containing ABC transporter n=1 Tax=Variovorax sp. ZS18.2.2 TaxID=2971255 RepID=UPI00215078A5|nr:peptidase domain-containing ABC transporter [Variovorax sp. ZS18.2.2]MCR6476504.1 peptidase domain-containing ABC transporter [Variovorax sp. ZS18.2.2]